ncbi:unnamed protein product [Cuscuta campestris]|uniref:Late embryogenesis abundant protein LEA-2 subgroup domain-containing protein n=1 Tax=Cuscuta campestris TaxID=132261 RepID=A0A484K3E3_9ASTE|nr:unnamed protein product [Cuscuta campestris]
MSGKECSHHKDRKKKRIRRCLSGLMIFLFVILLLILIIWAIIQPKKPNFVLRQATIFNFNVSAPNVFSTTIQVTVTARNPNSNVGIYYDKLDVYATYSGQQVTYFSEISPVYQGHKDVNVWSPFLRGNNVPIAPFYGPDLTRDKADGAVWLTFKIAGRVRWRVGDVITGRYHLHVDCPAFIPLGTTPGDGGIVVGNTVKYQLSQSCDVSV